MQSKLLQVLDTRELRRVGGTRVHRVDVRVIAATNKELAQEVGARRFREDLYYRLNVVNVTLPSLRERKEDIPLLVEHFLRRFRVTGQKAKTITPDALRLLVEYPWPGNVRELANTIERLMILAQEVGARRFREDLYYRLNVVNVILPSLRERKEDIPLLVEHFLRRFRVTGQRARTIAPDALRLVVDYPWPGNVRELANTIERLMILSPGDVIGPEDLPPNIQSSSGQAGGPASLAEMERLHVTRVLAETGGRKMKAARLLGIDLKTLNSKIKRYNIPI